MGTENLATKRHEKAQKNGREEPQRRDGRREEPSEKSSGASESDGWTTAQTEGIEGKIMRNVRRVF
jgi:hypothetical protein